MAADFSKIGKSNVNRSKSHERNVAKWLSTWAGVEFRRRRVTGRDLATRMVEMTADVIPVQGNFLFSIEAKCGARFSFDSLLSGIHTCIFTEWWHQTCYDAQFSTQDQGRPVLPMLFFKPTITTNWIAISTKAAGYLQPKDDSIYSGNTRFIHCLSNPPCSHPVDLLWFPHVLFTGYGRAGEIAGDVSHTKKPKIVKLKLDDVLFCRWHDFADNVDPASVLDGCDGVQQLRSQEQTGTSTAASD